jgi:hypothetical protein
MPEVRRLGVKDAVFHRKIALAFFPGFAETGGNHTDPVSGLPDVPEARFGGPFGVYGLFVSILLPHGRVAVGMLAR